MIDQTPAIQPLSWLREMMRFKPGYWRWGLSIRSAIAVALPFAIGFWLDDMQTFLWLALGTQIVASGERAGPYQLKFRQLLISVPIGAAGYLLGYATAMPWFLVVAVMACIGIVAGILSSYSAALSMGCLQMLLVAAIAIGNPSIGSFWWPALLFLAGAVFYGLLLGIEACLIPQRPWHGMQAKALRALAHMAETMVRGEPIDAFRRRATDQMAELYGAMLAVRSDAAGRNHLADQTAWQLQRLDTVFALLLDTSNKNELTRAACTLEAMAQAVGHDRSAVVASTGQTIGSPLERALQNLAMSLAGKMAPAATIHNAESVLSGPSEISRLGLKLDRLVPGRDAILGALALGLCMGLAYASHWLIKESHWYWVPLTVGMVMKPDMGSVFARGVLRCIGTAFGIIVGSLLLALIPKGLLFALILGLLAAILPWAKQLSYGVQAFVLTPLVLMLIDAIIPGPQNVNFAGQRLVDTLIGSAIVIVFGHLIWPKQHSQQLSESFRQSCQALAQYLLASLASVAGQKEMVGVAETRRIAYGKLADIRMRLQKQLGDPPPASTEAANWFPLITSAERICDHITAYSAHPAHAVATGDDELLKQLASRIAHFVDDDGKGDVDANLARGTPEAELAASVDNELNHARIWRSGREQGRRGAVKTAGGIEAGKRAGTDQKR